MRQGAISGDQSSKAQQERIRISILMHWEVTERRHSVQWLRVDSGVEILSLPHTTCVALDKLLNLSVEFSVQLLHLQMDILLLPNSEGY